VNINCFMCGCAMRETTASINTGWGKYKVTIDGVKALECPECGEMLYSDEEVGMIQNLCRGLADLDEKEKPELLNVKETADLLRVSSQTIYNMIKDGRLKAVKMGREWRFMRKDIESLIDGHEYQAAARRLSQSLCKPRG
jgi:excisionase family DNA binding protein/YgiT-type zinc finger domain-containing protein